MRKNAHWSVVPISAITGVGTQKAELLAQLDVYTLRDLLYLAPNRFDDFRVRPLHEVQDGEKVTVLAMIQAQPQQIRFAKNKSRIICQCWSEPLHFKAIWFNQPFLFAHLQQHADWMLTGKWDAKKRQLVVSASEKYVRDPHALLEGSKQTGRAGTVQPVYPLVNGLTQAWMRKTMVATLTRVKPYLDEWLPLEWVQREQFPALSETFEGLHLPQDEMQAQAARRRLAYEECLIFQAKLQSMKRARRKQIGGTALAIKREAVRDLAQSLPFKLTTGQKYVIKDLLDDMESAEPMQRLLQGDVGSGKTVVAAIAMYAATTAGAQAAFMVPTELLAEQQAKALDRFLSPYGVQTALLTGRTGEKARREILAGLQMGIIQVIVGTHALIQNDVFFRQLGLVVIDEQHRFGVQQRAVLREKGLKPDLLSMTATPIPRTLAITLWGDMDVSVLREKPAGRQPIDTHWLRHNQFIHALTRIKEALKAGRQAYVICPLIEESEMLEVQNAIDTAAQVQQAMQPYQVGLLHGRLPGSEKEDVMSRFVSGEIHVLVSTTVVEVGVDVANATEMIILDADRFGLSQLHQLRGRVGRGSERSRCFLIADPKSENGKQRMTVMTETNDGFEIAQRDLELRGPGDYFGTKQSGVPSFRFVDLLQDGPLMEIARDDATSVLRDDRLWMEPQYAAMRDMLTVLNVFDQELSD